MDWFTNLTFFKTKAVFLKGGGKLHKGFSEAVVSVFEGIYALAAGWSDKPLFVTGHSLGGALAVVAAMYLRKRNVSVAGVYTFGAPRVFNAVAAREYDRVVPFTYRFECAGDAVARMPKLGFWHVGEHNFFAMDGQLHVEPSRRLVLSNNLQDLVSEFVERQFFDWEDHKMTLYIFRIGELGNRPFKLG